MEGQIIELKAQLWDAHIQLSKGVKRGRPDEKILLFLMKDDRVMEVYARDVDADSETLIKKVAGSTRDERQQMSIWWDIVQIPHVCGYAKNHTCRTVIANFE